ncbi:MAG: efflux RND transporter periplasmic adaptor subunit [Desulfovibrionaceae bacterium]|nr:efflux RND transporter periplasmic adaptor subunit [Desulfovibrionaceae bacterium]
MMPHAAARTLVFLAMLCSALLPAVQVMAQGADVTPTGREAKAELRDITEWYEAVGTIRPKTETTVEAQVQAKIMDIKVRPGQTVEKGELLVVLDDRELAARAERANQALTSARATRNQAREGIASAKAAFDNAQANYQRIKTLFASHTVTAQEMDRTEAEFLRAQSALVQARDGFEAAEGQAAQAEKALEEARLAAGHAMIHAQAAGEVVKRQAEPGDLAFPGKPLLVLHTGRSLRLEALVREGLIFRVKPGGVFPVRVAALAVPGENPALTEGVPALGDAPGLGAEVEEIVPMADPLTRTFLVKAALPETPGLYPGMFGRLFIPMGTRQAVVAPRAAVRRVGQLEMVTVMDDGVARAYAVKTGQALEGGYVEILSGLSGGETLLVTNGNR